MQVWTSDTCSPPAAGGGASPSGPSSLTGAVRVDACATGVPAGTSPAQCAPISSPPRYLTDRAPYHYMANVSSLSFDPRGQFATCQESLNDYIGHMRPNFFMGPSLYSTTTPLVSSKQDACAPGETCFLIHIDMLHEAPLCMGIAHDDAPSLTQA